MTGEERPRPGTGVFHLTPLLDGTSQVVGVGWSSAMPEAPGPRKEGQWSAGAGAENASRRVSARGAVAKSRMSVVLCFVPRRGKRRSTPAGILVDGSARPHADDDEPGGY